MAQKFPFLDHLARGHDSGYSEDVLLMVHVKRIFGYLQMLDCSTRLERGTLLINALISSWDVCMCLFDFD